MLDDAKLSLVKPGSMLLESSCFELELAKRGPGVIFRRQHLSHHLGRSLSDTVTDEFTQGSQLVLKALVSPSWSSYSCFQNFASPAVPIFG